MALNHSDFPKDATNSYILLGNVNTGKSTIFNQICKKHAIEGNYPGTTVSISIGKVFGDENNLHVIDAPGSNTIYGENEDEFISKAMILTHQAAKIIFIADAKNLKRSLAFYLHYQEFNLPSIFNINMMDEALIRNIDIDIENLSNLLGTQVNTTVAIEGAGINQLKKHLTTPSTTPTQLAYPEFIENYLQLADKITGTQKVSKGLLLSLLTESQFCKLILENELEPSNYEQIMRLVEQTKSKSLKSIEIILMDFYLQEAEKIYNQTVLVSQENKLPFSDRLGILSRNPLTGIPIALLIIATMFLFVGKFGAEFLVGLIEGQLFGQIIVPFVEKFFHMLNFDFLTRAIVGKYGLLSVGLSLAIGVVMPVLLCFYFFFGCLENSGYLPRLGILLNNIFKKIGLSGKGVLPMIMGFSCITMAILTTRVLDTQKEKNIATFLLVQGIPCAPLFAVMLVLLSPMPIWTYFFIFGVIAFKLFITGYFTNKIFKGRQPEFIMEIPVLRIPKFKGLVLNSTRRTYLFLKEAIPVFLMATFFIFILDEVGGITFIENFTKPVLSGFVGLPKESVNVFLMSFIRREAGVALLTDFVEKGIFNQTQIVVNLLMISFLIPCINAILVIIKERGGKIATAICVFVLVYAILLGALINYLLMGFQKIGLI